MLIVIAVLLAAGAAILSIRTLKRARVTGRYGTVLGVLAAAMVAGLALLAATGRLSFIVVVVAALIPFLRQLLGLLQYVPLLRRLFGDFRSPGNRQEQAESTRKTDPAAMTRERAIEILGLGPQPTTEEVIAAHRRLMQKLHPDRGGSTYLAQQLNEARKALLDRNARG